MKPAIFPQLIKPVNVVPGRQRENGDAWAGERSNMMIAELNTASDIKRSRLEFETTKAFN